MRRIRALGVVGVFAMVGLMGGGGDALAASALQEKLSQQVAGGGVTVVATLLKDQGEATAIKLALETHSVNLDGYRFEAIASLRDDTGNTYPVVGVQQATGGGHHRGAILQFGKVPPDAKAIELIVKDVAGVKERTFRWSLTD